MGSSVVQLRFALSKDEGWIRVAQKSMDDEDDPESDIIIAKEIKMVGDCRARLQSRYLQYVDLSRPLDWMTVTSTSLMLVVSIFKPQQTTTPTDDYRLNARF
ncbi:hypothetical protein KCU78_g6811, partial [Aureobasidium melanogenum]